MIAVLTGHSTAHVNSSQKVKKCRANLLPDEMYCAWFVTVYILLSLKCIFSGCEIKPYTSFSPQTVPVSDLYSHTSPNSRLSYTLTGLIGGNNYTLWMASSTVQGDGGVHSEPLILLLPEDGQSDTRTHKRSINEDKVNTHTHKLLLGKLDNNCMRWLRVSPEGRSALFFSELFNLKKKLHKNTVIENSFQYLWKEIKKKWPPVTLRFEDSQLWQHDEKC